MCATCVPARSSSSRSKVRTRRPSSATLAGWPRSCLPTRSSRATTSGSSSREAGAVKFAIVVFPGSNCDADCYHIARDLLDCEADYVWHKDTSLKGADAVILPGGFAYGDYLRAGALARFSPVMESVAEFAKSGGPVLGICNGFQVLLEAGLLPGAVRVNRGLRYVCRDVFMRVESNETAFTRLYEP